MTGKKVVTTKYRPGTLRSALLQFLSDRKVHQMSEVSKRFARRAKSPRGLVRAVRRDGRRTKKWTIALDKDTVQLKSKLVA
jgi:hypothetical protein